MDIVRHRYTVLNSTMDPEFRLTPEGLYAATQDLYARTFSGYWSGAFDLRERNMIWIISDFTFRLTGPMPYWTEEFDVESWISEKPVVKVRQSYRVSTGGREFAIGDCTWAMLDMTTRRPVRTGNMLPDIDIHPEIALGTYHHKFPAKKDEMYLYRHLTNIGDMDFNYHVTNATYAKVCLNALPREYYKSHALEEFSIRFEHESFVGEELECHIYGTDEPELWVYEIHNSKGETCSSAYARYSDHIPSDTILDHDLKVRELHGMPKPSGK